MSLPNEQTSDKSKKVVFLAEETTSHDVLVDLSSHQEENSLLPDLNNNTTNHNKQPQHYDQSSPTLVSLPPQNIIIVTTAPTNSISPTTPSYKNNLHQSSSSLPVAASLSPSGTLTKMIDSSAVVMDIPNGNTNETTILVGGSNGIVCAASSPPIHVHDHPLQSSILSQQQHHEQGEQSIVGITTINDIVQPQQPIITTTQEPPAQPQEGKKKKKRKEDYDDDDTENDLLDNDLEFTPDELELLKSQDLPPISLDALSEIPQIPPHMRTRLTILQQQQIIYSLHSLNMNDKQRKELMLLGNVMKRITQDELMKCSIFESVNVYLFILCVSTLAAAVGTLALALIYFVVLKDAVAEGTFSIVLSAIFTITLVGSILLCIVFNIKNRPKHKFRKATLAHYHEVFEEAIYDIGVRFFPNFEIEFDYHNIIDNDEIEELESKRRKLRQNYRYYEYYRSKRLLSKFSTEQLLCYLHITSAENFDGIKKLFKLQTRDDNAEQKDETGNRVQPQDLNQNIVQIKKIPSYFSSFSTTNNSGIYVPAAVIEQTSTPGDNIWYSVCCAFGGLCTLIIVLIFLLFSAICLFFPLVYGRNPKIPIFNTFPIEVGYGMVGVLGLTFLVLLCFFSCSVYCCVFVKATNRSYSDGDDPDGEEQNRPMCCCYFELDNNDDDGFLAPVGDLI